MKRNFQKAFSLIELSIVILIIGLLVTGAVKGASVYKKIKIVSAASLTNNSVVSSISNLETWYETTSSKSFYQDNLSDGQDLSVWRDINPTKVKKLNLEKNNFGTGNLPDYAENCLMACPALTLTALMSVLWARRRQIFRDQAPQQFLL